MTVKENKENNNTNPHNQRKQRKPRKVFFLSFIFSATKLKEKVNFEIFFFLPVLFFSPRSTLFPFGVRVLRLVVMIRERDLILITR